MNDLNNSIHTLGMLYLLAMDKGYSSFANDVRHYLDELMEEQRKAHIRNLHRLEMTYGKAQEQSY